jgi:hypothetical protein
MEEFTCFPPPASQTCITSYTSCSKVFPLFPLFKFAYVYVDR